VNASLGPRVAAHLRFATGATGVITVGPVDGSGPLLSAQSRELTGRAEMPLHQRKRVSAVRRRLVQARPPYVFSSRLAVDGDVTAPSRMEQSAEVAGGPSELVLNMRARRRHCG
jgi:hypothetical protein